MICFILGRESRLSIAELVAFFPDSECLFAEREFAIFDKITSAEVAAEFSRLGGSIKALEINKEIESQKDFPKFAVKTLIEKATDYEGKFTFALAQYGIKIDIFKMGIQIKKEAKKSVETNLRFVNKDSNNVNAAVYKKDGLGANGGCELNLLVAGERAFIGTTIAYQDVDEYSKRDYSKERDMQVGMLPPKLAQIMINMAGKDAKGIYDPFCGLGTILMESALGDKKEIYGSDLSEEMVKASSKNIALYLDKSITYKIFRQDASKIETVMLLKDKSRISIATEGYLGSVMTRGHVTLEKIEEERRKLARIYEGFFAGLQRLNFKGTIVICFPFWQLNGKYVYFEEIYTIIKRYGFNPLKLLPENIEFKESRSGSLLYHRPNQQVGREVFCLRQSK